jgi:hypothetical protein
LVTGALAAGDLTAVFEPAFTGVLAGAFAVAVFLVGIVLLLFFECWADARASFFDALRLAAVVFFKPLSLEALSFVLEFFL